MQPGSIIRTIPFVLAAILLSHLLRPRYAPGLRTGARAERIEAVAIRILSYWALSATVLFLLAVPPVVFVLLGVAAAALKPKDDAEAVAYYLGILFAVPISYEYTVPFPGVNYLLILNHPLLLAITVLVPLSIRARKPSEEEGDAPGRSLTGLFFVAFYAVTLVLLLRGTETLTNSLRAVITQTLLVAVPYFALTRGLRSAADVRLAVTGLTVAMLALCMIGLASGLQGWLYYLPVLAQEGFIGWLGASRGGSVRVGVTLVSTMLGYLMVFLGAVLIHERQRLQAAVPTLVAWIGTALIVAKMTGSRGVVIALAAAIGAFVFMRLRSNAGRVALSAFGLTAATVLYVSLQSGGFDAVDAYGTFDYRQRLIELSWEQFKTAPLIGDAGYADAPIFEELRQGQGIIDFVNAYVQIGLASGLLGLFLFLGAGATAFFGATRKVDRLRAMGTPIARRQAGLGVVLGAMLASLLVMHLTISFVSYLFDLVVILFALSSAFVRAADPVAATEAERAAEPAPAAIDDPVSDPPREPEAEAASDGGWPAGYVPGRMGWPG